MRRPPEELVAYEHARKAARNRVFLPDAELLASHPIRCRCLPSTGSPFLRCWIGRKQRSLNENRTPLSPNALRVMLLGAGELGKEVIIALQRLGVEVIAVTVMSMRRDTRSLIVPM